MLWPSDHLDGLSSWSLGCMGNVRQPCHLRIGCVGSLGPALMSHPSVSGQTRHYTCTVTAWKNLRLRCLRPQSIYRLCLRLRAMLKVTPEFFYSMLLFTVCGCVLVGCSLCWIGEIFVDICRLWLVSAFGFTTSLFLFSWAKCSVIVAAMYWQYSTLTVLTWLRPPIVTSVISGRYFLGAIVILTITLTLNPNPKDVTKPVSSHFA